MTLAVYLLSVAVYGLTASAGPMSTSSFSTRQQSTLTLAPVIQPSANHAHNAINDSYIVVLKPGVSADIISQHVSFVQDVHAASPLDDFAGGLRHIYDSHLKGYAGRFSPATIDAIRSMPEVDYIEQDQIVTAYDMKTQTGAPWGLARISHRDKLTLGTFTKYEYDANGGAGVDVYIIDTGINIHHVEFEGRAIWGKTIPTDATDSDGNGHGTHCAGTVASRKYGVAKAATVIAVKVLGDNGSGSMSDVVKGVLYAADSAAAKAKAARAEFAATGKTAHRGSVANMSLGGGKARSLDDAVNGAVEAGMHFAVAAGNDNRDACDYSPAAAEKAVTVGASTLADERAYFSNHGKCVDVFAPGLNILSTWTGGNDTTNSISGTSMASPHTAGLLAYYLSLYGDGKLQIHEDGSMNLLDTLVAAQGVLGGTPLQGWLGSWLTGMLFPSKREEVTTAPIPPTIPPAQLKKAVLNLATPNRLVDLPKDTVNLLIFNNATKS